MFLQVCTVHDSDVLWSEQNSRKSHTGWISAVVTEYRNTESTFTGGDVSCLSIYWSTHSSHLSTSSLGKICSFQSSYCHIWTQNFHKFQFFTINNLLFSHFPKYPFQMIQKFKRFWNFTCIVWKQITPKKEIKEKTLFLQLMPKDWLISGNLSELSLFRALILRILCV